MNVRTLKPHGARPTVSGVCSSSVSAGFTKTEDHGDQNEK